jgi:hypothetical protein
VRKSSCSMPSNKDRAIQRYRCSNIYRHIYACVRTCWTRGNPVRGTGGHAPCPFSPGLMSSPYHPVRSYDSAHISNGSRPFIKTSQPANAALSSDVTNAPERPVIPLS